MSLPGPVRIITVEPIQLPAPSEPVEAPVETPAEPVEVPA